MTKLGLVTNLRSQRNRRGIGAIEEVMDGAPDVPHERLIDMDQLPRVLAGFSGEGVDVIAVNGGDGTVQAVLTELLEARPFARVPPLAILPGGMTNTIAADVGLRGSPARALANLVAAAREDRAGRHFLDRHILRVENARGCPPQRGMLFGAAGIVRAIEVCRTEAHGRGLKSEWAGAATLIGLLANWLLLDGRSEVFRGDEIAISLDGEPSEHGSHVVVLATTLDRLILGSRPFWNTESGPVRFTSISDPPKSLLRWAYAILYGGAHRAIPEATYRSRGARRVVLEMACPFALDGQLFEPEEGQGVYITAEDKVSFLQLSEPKTSRPKS